MPKRTLPKLCSMILVVFTTTLCHGQQQPMYTQYMFNGLVLNPAYAGSQQTFTATALYRKQWVGMQGAPETQTFSAHSPLDDLRNSRRRRSPVSMGLTIYHDRVAITGHSGLLAAYAYKISTGRSSFVSFGIQGGFSLFRIRYSELELDDPSFSDGDILEFKPDAGAGIYYQTQRFYAGISAPQMLRPVTGSQNTSLTAKPHMFVTAGYVFDLSRAVKLKPSFLMKHSTGGVYQLDVNCNVFLSEMLNLGISWRSAESISALVNFQINERFAAGYAYDFGCGSEFSRLSSGSHELMINYRVPRKNIRTINPRFF